MSRSRAASVAADPYADRYLIAIAVTTAAVLELIDTSIVNVAIPHMMGTLGATLDEIAWVSVGYIVANVIVIPMSPWLSAYFGRRRYLTGSIALFVLASFLCGAAWSLWSLVAFRVLQGLGGGALLSTAQATLFEAFPPAERGVGQAIFGMGVMVGPTIGPTLGGYIVDTADWRWIFYINVPLGILSALMVWTYVRDAAHQERAEEVDWLGIFLLTLCIGALQFMLERGERYDWFDSPLVTGLCVTSVVAGVLLVWRELTYAHPVIDLRVLRSRQLATGVLFAFALGFALFGSVFVLPVFLQQLHGFTAMQTGLVILPGAIASAVTMAFTGRRLAHVDARLMITLGAALFFVSMWRLSGLSLDAGAPDVFWPLILRGIGLGLLFVPLTGASMADLGMRQLAQGTSLFNLLRQLGGSVGIAVMATALQHFTKEKKAGLAEHVTSVGADAAARVAGLSQAMVARGMPTGQARQAALAILDRQVTAQASVLAFSRVYEVSAMLLVGALPLLLLWKHGRSRGRVDPGH